MALYIVLSILAFVSSVVNFAACRDLYRMELDSKYPDDEEISKREKKYVSAGRLVFITWAVWPWLLLEYLLDYVIEAIPEWRALNKKYRGRS